MFPLWEKVVAPVLHAAEARRVVEIGALRGEQTQLLLDTLGSGAELHVIDPVPGFDPDDHRERFGEGYHFHRRLSLDVLDSLPPMDAALIDGDHNWYTVFHELRLLRDGARAVGAALPVLILHDVGWPYGRRDLYYDPATIPAEFRQPHRRAGMRPGRPDLLADGQGMSAGLWNAEAEGGPRNGVMTALDDFVAAHDRSLRVVFLPLYFGLAIVAEVERLDRQPALAAALDHLESAEGRLSLLQLGEQIRVRGVANHHTVARRSSERIAPLAARYLETLVRELAEGDATTWLRLERLRAGLEAVRASGGRGDVVVVGARSAGPVVLASADREAHDPGGHRIWIAGPPDEAGGSEGAIHDHLLRLDLPGQVQRVSWDRSPEGDEARPEQVAVVWVGADGDPRGEAVSRLRPLLVEGGAVISASDG